MGRRSLTGGVTPIGRHRIQFDFTVDGRRYRPTLPWVPHEANLRRARSPCERAPVATSSMRSWNMRPRASRVGISPR